MSNFQYKDLNICYNRVGSGSPVLLLHGWGTSGESFAPLIEGLKHTHDVIYLDFPGFGNSDEPKTPYSLGDYTDFTEAFIKALDLKDPVLIGHSFGGRVAIKLSERLAVSKMILINSAGVKPERQKNYYLKVYGYKCFRTLARLPLLSWLLKEPLEAYRSLYSSADYKSASPIMKQVLSKVVNEDLTPLLSGIKASTLLIWGDEDTSTPLSDAKKMEALIPDSGLVVFEQTGHFAYLEQAERTLAVIQNFLGGSQ